MPDQTPLSPKIEDLKARVRLDPKSRLFVPLAEELRKIGRHEDAEAVLRSGLEHHSGYLSAWISLGRCLIERGERTEATGALMNALSIDPGNVVAARMLADNYLALGEKVEAIKKLKLVRALLPSDSSVEDAITSLERELGQGPTSAVPAASEPAPQFKSSSEHRELSGAPLLQVESPEPESEPEQTVAAGEAEPETVESRPEPSGPSEMQVAASRPFFLQGDEQDDEPAAAAAEERQYVPEPTAFERLETSPAAEPLADSMQQDEISAAAFPGDEPAPFEAEREQLPASDDDLDETEDEVRAEAPVDPEISTLTMADLYARQGHVEAARDIYLRMLERDPANDEVKRKLDLLGDAPGAAGNPPSGRREAVRKLESWLQKVGPR